MASDIEALIEEAKGRAEELFNDSRTLSQEESIECWRGLLDECSTWIQVIQDDIVAQQDESEEDEEG